MHLWARNLPRKPNNYVWGTKAELRARVGRPQTSWSPSPSNFIAGRPKAALLFWFFGDFRCGLPLFICILVLYINIKKGENRMLNVWLTGDHLYGK